MHPPAAALCGPGRSVGGTRQLGEGRADCGERAHETAGAQQLAAAPAARGQIGVEPLLIDLVHMEQPVGRALVIGAILDVLADHPGAFLVAAAEQTAALMQMRAVIVLVLLVVLVIVMVVRHCPPTWS